MVSKKTSVLEITQKLNISNGSFHYHFANIEELLQVVGTTVVDTFLDEIGRVERDDPATRIACGVLIGLNQIDRNPKLQPIVLRVFTDRIDRHEGPDARRQEYQSAGRAAGSDDAWNFGCGGRRDCLA